MKGEIFGNVCIWEMSVKGLGVDYGLNGGWTWGPEDFPQWCTISG